MSTRTAAKWVARFRAEGVAGLRDRSSRPRRPPRQTPAAQQALVLCLRVEHRLPAFQIARSCGLSKTTVSRLLRRHDLHRHAATYQSSPARATFLPGFLHSYNWHRPHHSLRLKTPRRLPAPAHEQPVDTPQVGMAFRAVP